MSLDNGLSFSGSGLTLEGPGGGRRISSSTEFSDDGGVTRRSLGTGTVRKAS